MGVEAGVEEANKYESESVSDYDSVNHTQRCSAGAVWVQVRALCGHCMAGIKLSGFATT